MKKVARFNMISFGQWKNDIIDTFGEFKFTEEEIKKMYESIQLPQRATKFSAGYDFHTPVGFALEPGETIKIPTGIRCEMNTDVVLLIHVRSSLGFKYNVLLANTTGVIDTDYAYAKNEGHIFVKLVNNGRGIVEVNAGDAICQGIFQEYCITEDDTVEASRTGGIGSTWR